MSMPQSTCCPPSSLHRAMSTLYRQFLNTEWTIFYQIVQNKLKPLDHLEAQKPYRRLCHSGSWDCLCSSEGQKKRKTVLSSTILGSQDGGWGYWEGMVLDVQDSPSPPKIKPRGRHGPEITSGGWRRGPRRPPRPVGCHSSVPTSPEQSARVRFWSLTTPRNRYYSYLQF